MTISAPTDISGCDIWLDADDGSTFTFLSGTRVGQWNDKSGNANHFDNEGTTPAPERQTATLNGRATVHWDDANSRLANITSYTHAQPLTGFVVCQWDSDGAYAYIYSASGGIDVGRRDSNVCRVDAGGSAFPSDTFAVSQDTPYYISAVFDGANSDARLNGVAQFTNLDIGSTGVGTTLRLGRQSGGSGLGNEGGFVAEFILYNRSLSGTEITDVEAYLVAKWFTAGGPPPAPVPFRRRLIITS